MGTYLRNRMVRIGLGLIVFGAGPLLAIIALAAVGIWPDPNPNPVGPGILAALTFWLGMICLVTGVVQVRRVDVPVGDAAAPAGAISRRPLALLVIGFVGLVLTVRGGFDILVLGWVNRGAVTEACLGVAALSWAVSGIVPNWFRR
ncbi:MAG: hypothetical protein ABIS00_03770 [Gemmatimonadales bacterium]